MARREVVADRDVGVDDGAGADRRAVADACRLGVRGVLVADRRVRVDVTLAAGCRVGGVSHRRGLRRSHTVAVRLGGSMEGTGRLAAIERAGARAGSRSVVVASGEGCGCSFGGGCDSGDGVGPFPVVCTVPLFRVRTRFLHIMVSYRLLSNFPCDSCHVLLGVASTLDKKGGFRRAGSERVTTNRKRQRALVRESPRHHRSQARDKVLRRATPPSLGPGQSPPRREGGVATTKPTATTPGSFSGPLVGGFDSPFIPHQAFRSRRAFRFGRCRRQRARSGGSRPPSEGRSDRPARPRGGARAACDPPRRRRGRTRRGR